MLANWVKQAVSSGGTGNLTLGSAVAGHIDLNTAIGQGPRFPYVIEDGNNRETGNGYLSASTTLVREAILETLVSGTPTRVSPTAINVTTSATVSVGPTVHNLLGAHSGNCFPNSGIEGMCSMGQVDETGTAVALASGFLYQFPFWWASPKMVSAASLWCAAAAAGATARIGITTRAANGKPGMLLREFTASATIDCASTGAKTAVPSSPLWLPSGFYYLTAACSSSTPTFKAPMYSAAGLFLGVDASGNRGAGLVRSFTYGALPTTDESGQSYSSGQNYRLSAWLK